MTDHPSSIGATAMTDELAIVAKLMRRGAVRSIGHPAAPEGMRTSAPLANPDGPEAAAVIRDLVEALDGLRSYGCPVCSGDCGSANPPVASCPMRQTSEALAKVRTPHHPDEGVQS